MRVELASVKPTVISVWRDSDPLPGEKLIERVLVESNDSFHAGRRPTVVGSYAHVSTPRLSQFLVEKSPEADRLVALLKKGPVKPRYKEPGVVLIGVDRIVRPDDQSEKTRSHNSREVYWSGAAGRVISVGGRPVRR